MISMAVYCMLTTLFFCHRIMFDICDKFAIDFDVKFNSSKSAVMRIGPRFDVTCAPLFMWL